ncbi:prephenate dehydrogenase [Bacillus sp. 1P06AnD]|uniref:prephenate dehydrogenase n=1 Tax=Bacillus sp. 1P06AnD TaxID=3132208 RepID=UPI00399FE09F
MRGRVFIIGLGLIGSSVALAIKNTHRDVVMSGYDINQNSMQLAKALGIIDLIPSTVQEGAEEADLIIIGTPVKQTEEILNTLAECSLKERCIITDVGSTKQKITETAQILEVTGATFIGGHPMAGSHKTGPAAAKAHLFENAFYLLTPGEKVEEKKTAELKAWLRGTKANFLVVPPEMHDQLTGVISHFPHIIAAGLVHQAKKTTIGNNLVTRLAAGGFRDITRIASSSPEMWRDILLHNRENLLQLMDEWVDGMQAVKGYLLEEDSDSIYSFFEDAKTFRDDLPIRSQGAIPSFYDLYVDVPDYSGVISEITGYLAKEHISITNIRILETREELYGVLVISFQNEDDRKEAEACIEKYTNYGVYIA